MLMMVQGKFHPWMGLALAILAGAGLLVLLLRRPEDVGTRSSPPVAEIGQPVPSVVQSAAKPPAAPIPGDTTTREVQEFQRHMRRTMLANHAWLMSPAARELFLAGHPREAAERNQLDLAAQYEEGDRDAAATLYSLVANCKASAVAAARSGAADGYASLAAQARERANQRFGVSKAKALAFIDLLDESEALDDAKCRSVDRIDSAALLESVRRAGSDGHVPSLASLGGATTLASEDDKREKYLLSASLLGDAESQWRLASLYRNHLANPDNRGKMRFWLEQAADQEPEAAFALGRCLQKACDGQPANPERAERLIESAAGGGSYSALQYLAGEDGHESAVDPVTRFAWREFRARLADDGCDANYLWRLLDGGAPQRLELRKTFPPRRPAPSAIPPRGLF